MIEVIKQRLRDFDLLDGIYCLIAVLGIVLTCVTDGFKAMQLQIIYFLFCFAAGRAVGKLSARKENIPAFYIRFRESLTYGLVRGLRIAYRMLIRVVFIIALYFRMLRAWADKMIKKY